MTRPCRCPLAGSDIDHASSCAYSADASEDWVGGLVMTTCPCTSPRGCPGAEGTPKKRRCPRDRHRKGSHCANASQNIRRDDLCVVTRLPVPTQREVNTVCTKALLLQALSDGQYVKEMAATQAAMRDRNRVRWCRSLI
eukprot:scaffold13893_cov27-Tisochrysis_lutea.AAC.5